MKSHQLYKHPIYSLWNSVKSRCYCKGATSYPFYGGRGILVCDEWKNNFLSFYNWALEHGWEKGLTIERVNSLGNYEPSNCLFIPLVKQSANRRHLKKYVLNGEEKILTEWCKQFNMPQLQVLRRLNIGWEFEKAITTPIKHHKT